MFDIIGVLLLAMFGVPQPDFDEGVGLGLEDATTLVDGKTVAEHAEDVRRRRRLYARLSKLALVLIVVGFVLQLIATW